MDCLSVSDTALKWKLSERTVRNYCAQSKIPGAFLSGKTWNIPENAEKPERIHRHAVASRSLLEVLKDEQSSKLSGGIYHKVQIELAYNSNHIEGSRLTLDQTRYIFETNTIGFEGEPVNVDDIVETANHFSCFDKALNQANHVLSERFIKEMHMTLENGTTDSRKKWFTAGDYKRLANEVGGRETTPPDQVASAMGTLLHSYNSSKKKTLEEILDFHVRFENIHPFQDGNGRVGRIIMFKECLRYGIVPFIIGDDMKMFYYRGLHEWDSEKGWLTDTCLSAQDRFKKYLDYFGIAY